jgi:phage baseplate assembly protein W
MPQSQISRDSTIYQNRDYSDLDLSFKRNIVTSDVVKKKGDNSIKQSLKVLVLTQMGDRLFHPEIGGNIYEHLFAPIMPSTTISIRKGIEDVINKYEPRVEIVNIDVFPDIDSNRYDVNITFSMINDPGETSVDFFLERIR